jgi:hypothetical protein
VKTETATQKLTQRREIDKSVKQISKNFGGAKNQRRLAENLQS